MRTPPSRADVSRMFPEGDFHFRVSRVSDGEVLEEFTGGFEDNFVSGSPKVIFRTGLATLWQLSERPVSDDFVVIRLWREGEELELPPCKARLIDRWFWYGQPEEGGTDHDPSPLLIAEGFWWPLCLESRLDEVLE